jgi:Coenzyme PQQ synthesis protein D (PqqD)
VSRPRLVKNVVRGELPDGEVVLSLEGGNEALIVNSIADAVLVLCDGDHTVPEIAKFVRDTVHVPDGADVDDDIAKIIAQLTRAGLIEAVG